MKPTKYNQETKKLTIKDWEVNDRPREKYMAGGATALTNAEIIAILLRTGNAQESAVELAKRLLSVSDFSINVLSKMSFHELLSIKGIGKTKAVTLLCAFELGKRLDVEKVEKYGKIDTCVDVVTLMKNKIAYLKYEEFWAIFLTHSNQILKIKQISKGGITNSVVDIRILLQEAIEAQATAFIVCHNHPSGSVRPSTADIEITDRIKESAKIMDINLIDHIIIYENKYYSFVENGKL